MINSSDTIVAIASPTSPAPRGVVRLSGDDVLKVLEVLGVKSPSSRPSVQEAAIETNGPLGTVLAKVMLWPTKRSYTGQPSAELHTYGSLPVLNAIVSRLIAAGARAAKPGEFTMRAFLAGRLDLTQAEAVLGVIDAEDRGSLDHALRQLAGNLSRPLEQVRSDLLDLLADVEAGLDFVDEDIEFISDEALVHRLTKIVDQLQETQAQMMARGGQASVVMIALRGEPNAGKSLLLNRLTGQDAAIVANVAGTTRDVVTIETDLDGHRVCFVDTAGVESPGHGDTDAFVTQQSQRQADRASAEAAIRIWCVDATRSDFSLAANRLKELASEGRPGAVDVWVSTKSDLPSSLASTTKWIATSGVTGTGIEKLKERLIHILASRDREETGSVIGTATRCRESLSHTLKAAKRAIELTRNGEGHEFVASELRISVDSLGEVTGAVYTDDILDRVFGRFCIGK